MSKSINKLLENGKSKQDKQQSAQISAGVQVDPILSMNLRHRKVYNAKNNIKKRDDRDEHVRNVILRKKAERMMKKTTDEEDDRVKADAERAKTAAERVKRGTKNRAKKKYLQMIKRFL